MTAHIVIDQTPDGWQVETSDSSTVVVFIEDDQVTVKELAPDTSKKPLAVSLEQKLNG